MARVARLAGALLIETCNNYFLVGNTKEPCDFKAAGFDHPGELDRSRHCYLKLQPRRAIELSKPYLTLNVEGEQLAALVAERLLIERNAFVSERLWRLLLNPSGEEESVRAESVDVGWLGEIPAPVWAIVRDTVLRCL